MDRVTPASSSSESMSLVRYSSTVREPYLGSTAKYGIESADDSESQSGLLEYWHILRRHKTAILLSALVGLIGGVLVGIPMKPVYRARTSLEVLNINEDFMNMKESNPTTTNDNSFDTSEEETQAQLLQGSALLNRVSAKLDPDSSTRKAPVMAISGWRSWLHLPEPGHMTEREKLVLTAIKTLKVRATPRTRVLEVTVDSGNREFATAFANTLVEEFIQQSLEARWDASHKMSEWLNREIDEVRSRLQKSENALQTYARESGLIFTDDNANVVTEKLQQVQQELSNVTADRIAKQSRFELAQNSPPDALADILHDDGLGETRSKLIEKRRQLADLSAIFNPEYSQVKRAEAELAALQIDYDRSRADVVKSIENDYREATRKEVLLSATYDNQSRQVVGQGEKEIQYNILKREAESNRQLYDTMLQQTKQASVALAMRASNVRIVDPADTPLKPVFPNFLTNAFVGVAAGFFLSIAVVTARDRADRALQQPGDVKLWTELAELGTIPSAFVNWRKTYGKTRGLQDRLIERTPGDRPQSVELITWEQKPSVVAEAFRSVLTSILFVGEFGNRPRVIVFTSAEAGDGKTTTVSNLAIATAEIRRKVLIIDADLRRPRMHKIFNLSNGKGLGDLLTEEFSSEDLTSLIQETSIPGISVITGGSQVQAAAHLLYLPNFELALTELRKVYDLILVDTPPMLQMTDARVAGRLADAVVIVARAGRTTRDALMVVKDRFAEDGIRVLGTVLNDWDPKRSGTDYGYRSYSGSRRHNSYAYPAIRAADE